MRGALVSTILVSLLFCTGSGKWLLPDEDAPRDRIVGGNTAAAKYRKGTALIYMKQWNSYYGHCTGSIIGRKWILSAAHCFEDDAGLPFGGNDIAFGVVPASYYATTQAAAERGIGVKSVFVHREYNGGDMRFDIALLELEEYIPWEYYSKVEIVDVPGDKTTVRAVGYGDLGENGPEAKTCMMVDVVYRNFDWCYDNEMYEGDYSRTNQLCAVSLGWPAGRTDTCYGDSGGPLFLKRADDKLLQIGITSFSNTGCAEEYGVPWYVKPNKFKWSFTPLIEQGAWGPYYRFAGDRTISEEQLTAAPSPSPSPKPPPNTWWPWWLRHNTTFQDNTTTTTNSTVPANANVAETENITVSLNVTEKKDGNGNSTASLNTTMMSNGATNVTESLD